ncbi:MAG: LLM class flavin-dependent oxidoreductase [Dehalococcoidia bacterium]|jgi:alkanesulfonate monooxygenase SsuD/methylene tetrahydromethanopterin reductase-like flavin-dependent oxidoreductase (luciferase family)|nr:MAG: Flavin-dependent oxidoreductase, luciferase family [Chloroflexota bacterium]
MQFGTFHLPLSPSPEEDNRVINQQFDCVELAENLGFHYAWLTEHNFTGEDAYGDPIPLAAALAQRTKKIRIGFAILQMAIHHPTRLLLQTSLLDNLLNGRLTVGIGRGSKFNEFEYVAFGVSGDDNEHRERMFEGIDYMSQAWKAKGSPIEFKGKYFDLKIPGVRPMPVQKPHPQIQMSGSSDETLEWAARHNYPIMLPRMGIKKGVERLSFFKNKMEEAKLSKSDIDKNLNQSTLQRSIYVAETDEQAYEEIQEPTHRLRKHLLTSRAKHNPENSDQEQKAKGHDSQKWSSPVFTPDEGVQDYLSRGVIYGSVKTVKEKIAELNENDIRSLMACFDWGDMDQNHVQNSMKKFGTEIMPSFL